MSAVVEMNPEPRRGRAVAVASHFDVVQSAMKTGNADIIRQAIDFAKELKAMANREAFDAAMADAKAKIPTIRRNREVDSGGRGPKYRFEDLAEIARTVDPILSECGLNYRYRVTSNPNEPVAVTCILSHRDGHSEETTLRSGPDNGPGRNAIQQIGSAITYLQRYTLKAALGLAVTHDDDGRGSEAPAAEPAAYVPPAGSVTQEQADAIRDLLESRDVKATAFLQWAHVPRIEDVPAEIFDECIAKIKTVGREPR